MSDSAKQALRRIFDWLAQMLRIIPAENKEEYRQFYLPSDIAQSKIVYVLLAITIALFAISDYMFLGSSLIFYGLILLRISLIVYTFFQFSYISRIKDYRSYDKSTLLYLVILVAGILLVNTSRPQNFLSHVIVADLAIFVFYLGVPTRFIFQAIPSLLFAIGEVFVIVSFNIGTPPAWFTAFFSLLFTSIIASLISLQLHSYRWQVFHDIAERRKSERFIAIGQTAGMVGHDIRNPLQAITSSLYLAKTEIDVLPESQEKNNALDELSNIQTQISYIDKIVSDLQDFARPLTPELTKANVKVIIEEAITSVRVPDNISVLIEVDETLPELMLDLTFMRRITVNLITNAVQAMPSGGKITVKAFSKNSNAYITIADTGTGIPENIKPKIFQPLMTTKAKGQGFGLVVVKRLVEAQGGTITFESQEGKGTKFTIQLLKS